MRSRTTLIVAISLVLAVLPFLAGCGATASPTAAPTAASTVAPTVAAKATNTAAPTAAPTNTAVPKPTATQGPVDGGKLVIAVAQDPGTLDPQKTAQLTTNWLGAYYLATLVAYDPTTLTFVPYLAESWKVGEDNLTIDFVIKKGLKFTDGTPLTAKEYAWSWSRALDPNTKNPTNPQNNIAKVDAVDDYTLRFTLKAPFAPIFNTLCGSSTAPVSKAAVDKYGDQFGMNPVSVGPFMVTEYKTGDRIVMKRNPDYAWAPKYATNKAKPYIDTLEIKIIAEVSTVLAGLEAGEIDIANVAAKDLARVQATNKFQLFEGLNQGMNPTLIMNTAKAPFTDVNVRKAINLAMDRKSMITVVAKGQAVEMHGPLSPSQPGYWSGVEAYGYGFDLAKAKDALKQAGYTYDAGGVATKDGKPFETTLLTDSSYDSVAQVAQQQLKALGITVKIQTLEANTAWTEMVSGKYEIGITGISNPDPNILRTCFFSKNIGTLNVSQVNDPALDDMLNAQKNTLDPTKRFPILQEIQKYMVDKAYVCPLFAPKKFYAVSNRVKGAVFVPAYELVPLYDAYILPK